MLINIPKKKLRKLVHVAVLQKATCILFYPPNEVLIVGKSMIRIIVKELVCSHPSLIHERFFSLLRKLIVRDIEFIEFSHAGTFLDNLKIYEHTNFIEHIPLDHPLMEFVESNKEPEYNHLPPFISLFETNIEYVVVNFKKPGLKLSLKILERKDFNQFLFRDHYGYGIERDFTFDINEVIYKVIKLTSPNHLRIFIGEHFLLFLGYQNKDIVFKLPQKQKNVISKITERG